MRCQPTIHIKLKFNHQKLVFLPLQQQVFCAQIVSNSFSSKFKNICLFIELNAISIPLIKVQIEFSDHSFSYENQ